MRTNLYHYNNTKGLSYALYPVSLHKSFILVLFPFWFAQVIGQINLDIIIQEMLGNGIKYETEVCRIGK